MRSAETRANIGLHRLWALLPTTAIFYRGSFAFPFDPLWAGEVNRPHGIGGKHHAVSLAGFDVGEELPVAVTGTSVQPSASWGRACAGGRYMGARTAGRSRSDATNGTTSHSCWYRANSCGGATVRRACYRPRIGIWWFWMRRIMRDVKARGARRPGAEYPSGIDAGSAAWGEVAAFIDGDADAGGACRGLGPARPARDAADVEQLGQLRRVFSG